MDCFNLRSQPNILHARDDQESSRKEVLQCSHAARGQGEMHDAGQGQRTGAAAASHRAQPAFSSAKITTTSKEKIRIQPL